MEREIKLHANKEQLKQILSLPVLVPLLAGPPRTERLISTYFDTLDLTFREEGIALRVRAIGDSFVQTLKIGSGQGVCPTMTAAIPSTRPARSPAKDGRGFNSSDEQLVK